MINTVDTTESCICFQISIAIFPSKMTPELNHRMSSYPAPPRKKDRFCSPKSYSSVVVFFLIFQKGQDFRNKKKLPSRILSFLRPKLDESSWKIASLHQGGIPNMTVSELEARMVDRIESSSHGGESSRVVLCIYIYILILYISMFTSPVLRYFLGIFCEEI